MTVILNTGHLSILDQNTLEAFNLGRRLFTSAQHLAAYLDEQVYRFNSRLDSDGGRFLETMRFVMGKRLTYETLTHGPLTLYG